MRCEYTFTYKDFLSSMKEYRRVSRKAFVGYWLYVWVLPAVGMLTFLFWLLDYVRRDDDLFTPFYWAACVGLGCALGFPARYRLGVKRAFKARNTLVQDRPMYFEFDDELVHFIVPGGTEITYPWKAFTNYTENEQVAVLFIKDAAFHTIPKRAMGEEGWAQVRQLVERNVGKAA